MLKTLTKDDFKLVLDLYRSINRFNEDELNNIFNNIEISKILCANIENNSITSLLITDIIKNNYYLEEVIFLNNDIEEIKNLITYTVKVLRNDERGIYIIYDNFPYSEIMHKMMCENGFKCNFVNYISLNEDDKIELIRPNIRLNDKEDDVKEYIYNNYVQEIKSNDLYLGITSELPEITSIHLENTNIAVIRDADNKVIGTARFGIIGESICLYSLYADSDEIYCDLINLIKNLTTKRIEIGFLPVRENLMRLLNSIGFKIFQTDYILKLN